MKVGVGYRMLLVAGLFVVSLVYLAPTLMRPLPDWWPSAFPREPIRLGLDLQGGIHLVLQVEVDKAVENALNGTMEDLKRELAAAQIQTARIERKADRILVQVRDPAQGSALSDLLKNQFPVLVNASQDGAEAGVLALTFDPKEQRRIREFAVDQSIETIRNRIDQFGVREPVIQRSGTTDILVQLPGIQDAQRAKDLIGKTAVLEFKIVKDAADDPSKPSTGSEVVYGQERDSTTGQVNRKVPYTLERKTLMTGEVIADARVRPSTQLEGPYVEIILNSRGAKLFEQITSANVGRRLAIVLDNTVYSAPVIRERIGGGRASITGNFDIKEARDLAIVLRAGALPAPVTIAEERTIGPTLGEDSIRRGMISFAVGGLLVVLFMVIYYRGAGLIADMALTLNVLFIIGALAAFEATLTLPGIAGLVLTTGMAVDANVLINERIREELRLGKSVRAAIEAGYERALPAILDTNITTLLSGIILFQFGSGPVKGFAVTLCIGLFTTVFTAVVCTRMVYDFMLAQRRMTTISI
jgi:preprotein translocase subunit SecD